VGVTVPRSIALAPIERRFRAELGAVLGILLLSVTLAVVLAHYLVRPVRHLETAAQALGRGELTSRVRVESGDGIGRLGAALVEHTVRRAAAAAEHAAIALTSVERLIVEADRELIALVLSRLEENASAPASSSVMSLETRSWRGSAPGRLAAARSSPRAARRPGTCPATRSCCGGAPARSPPPAVAVERRPGRRPLFGWRERPRPFDGAGIAPRAASA